ncbi:MAG: hypothetical protein JO189_14955 [Deltaproteobacteria bacterium]|nr:hypothetical protein [Deltaproteobacteria bacterium]
MRPWWPLSPLNAYWPSEAIDAETIPAFISAFKTLGYEECADDSLEKGFEKIAIYATANYEPKHAARQLRDGGWTSKMGIAYWPDIRHDSPEAVSGPAYGMPVCYMKRPRKRLTPKLAWFRAVRRLRILIWELATFARWVRYGGTMYDNR